MIHRVYILKAGEFYKIGLTSNTIDKRIKELQTGCPYEIKEIFKTSSLTKKEAFELERFLHKKFKRFHSYGEWFKLNNNKLKELVLFTDRLSSIYIFKEYKQISFDISCLYRNKKNKNSSKYKIEKLKEKRDILIRGENNG